MTLGHFAGTTKIYIAQSSRPLIVNLLCCLTKNEKSISMLSVVVSWPKLPVENGLLARLGFFLLVTKQGFPAE